MDVRREIYGSHLDEVTVYILKANYARVFLPWEMS